MIIINLLILIFNYYDYNIYLLNKWQILVCFIAIGSLNYHMVKSKPPINGTFNSM
jgi:uncharacterized membrane protein